MSFFRQTWSNAKLITTTHQEKIISLQNIKQSRLATMRVQYPHILVSKMNGNIAYMLRSEPPDQIISQGGFVAHANIWFSNTGSGDSRGTICFSLLPEVTTIFLTNRVDLKAKKSAYIYACLLDGEFVFPGGKWRQVMSPGAFPLPNFWRVREVVNIKDDQVALGPVFGHGHSKPGIQGERYTDYMSNHLRIPKQIDVGEDFPYEYDIQDTEMTALFQKDVSEYYQRPLDKTSSLLTLK